MNNENPQYQASKNTCRIYRHPENQLKHFRTHSIKLASSNMQLFQPYAFSLRIPLRSGNFYKNRTILLQILCELLTLKIFGYCHITRHITSFVLTIMTIEANFLDYKVTWLNKIPSHNYFMHTFSKCTQIFCETSYTKINFSLQNQKSNNIYPVEVLRMLLCVGDDLQFSL